MAAVFLSAMPAWAQQKSEDLEFFAYERLSLEQSLDMRTSVATRSSLPARESPGIITIVTRDEIQNSGARDLLDVLRLVPGFELGLDIQGIVGMGFRGMWGQEGKILVMVDGQLYNDLGYAGTQIDRIPVEQIERVEIIRGPGSVVYGGNAELAVINITTRGWREKGLQAAGSYGRGTEGGDRRTADLRYGGENGGLQLSGAAHFSQTQRSDRGYSDAAGDSYLMRGNSDLTTRSLNLGLSRGGFRSRFILDEFLTTQRDAFGANQPRATSINSYLYLAEAAYDWRPSENWLITPRFNLNHQRPWNEHDDFFIYDKTFDRYQENLTVRYELPGRFTLLGGAEFQQDNARVCDLTPDAGLWPGASHQVNYHNEAYFAEGQFELPFGTVVGGGRYEHHSLYKGSLVPRLAWTKRWERLHFKALYSEAFRTPSLENLRLSPGIRPERMTTYEIESGYRFREDLFASVALFDMTLRRPIVYHNDPLTGVEFYSNDDLTGARGFELTGKWKRGPHYADASYSFYSATKNRVPLYAVPGHSDALLGWPMHKLALNSSFALGNGLSINPSGALLAERYAFYTQDAAGNMLARRCPNAVMLNIFVQKKGIFRKGLDIGVGVFDLLGSNYSYIQPYDSGHAPLPGRSREFTMRVKYGF
jgi:outer membrane cobalamin receptor